MDASKSSAVLKNTFSVADLYRRADVLKRFLEFAFFKTAGEPHDRTALMRSFCEQDPTGTDRLDCEAVAAWGPAVFDAINPDNLYDSVTRLKRLSEELPVLTLYVPVRLGAPGVERIATWCRTNLSPDVILDVRIDPSSVGGCKFAYNNAFHDVSFAYFEKKARGALVERMRSYDA